MLKVPIERGIVAFRSRFDARWQFTFLLKSGWPEIEIALLDYLVRQEKWEERILASTCYLSASWLVKDEPDRITKAYAPNQNGFVAKTELQIMAAINNIDIIYWISPVGALSYSFQGFNSVKLNRFTDHDIHVTVTRQRWDDTEDEQIKTRVLTIRQRILLPDRIRLKLTRGSTVNLDNKTIEKLVSLKILQLEEGFDLRQDEPIPAQTEFVVKLRDDDVTPFPDRIKPQPRRFTIKDCIDALTYPPGKENAEHKSEPDKEKSGLRLLFFPDRQDSNAKPEEEK